MSINVWTDPMQHAELFGKPVLFTNWLILRDLVPKGWHCYARHHHSALQSWDSPEHFRRRWPKSRPGSIQAPPRCSETTRSNPARRPVQGTSRWGHRRVPQSEPGQGCSSPPFAAPNPPPSPRGGIPPGSPRAAGGRGQSRPARSTLIPNGQAIDGIPAAGQGVLPHQEMTGAYRTAPFHPLE